jgi:Mrp family chromosome partitioning ATPase
MSEEQQREQCEHNCSSCSKSCGANGKNSLLKSLAKGAVVKKVIAVASGKGGVGKSVTCALLAAMAQKKGYRAAILDADITGPSIPKMFGVTQKAVANERGILPVESKEGIQIMSMNALLEDESQPVLWRGSLIAGAAVQFWTDVLWQDVDYMFIDMPPGTGDVPLSVYQSLPLSGIVMVTTPQDLVKMIVEKAFSMAQKMSVPVLGMVENMSYIACPCCGKKIEAFGQSKVAAYAAEYGIPAVARMPIDQNLALLSDMGRVYDYDASPLEGIFNAVEKA